MKRFLFIFSLVAGFFLTACAHEKNLEGLPPEKLYLDGYHAFQKTDYEKAAEYFDEIEKQHPYSVWAERAQIMAAYSYYRKNEYDDAIMGLGGGKNLFPDFFLFQEPCLGNFFLDRERDTGQSGERGHDGDVHDVRSMMDGIHDSIGQ